MPSDTAEPSDEALIDMWRHEEWEVACAARDTLRARLASNAEALAKAQANNERNLRLRREEEDKVDALKVALAECSAALQPQGPTTNPHHGGKVYPSLDAQNPTTDDAAVLDEYEKAISSFRTSFTQEDIEASQDWYNDTRAAVLARMSAAEWKRELVHKTIAKTLQNHRLQYSGDGDGGHYPLLDALTPEGETVAVGQEEIELLTDAIYLDLLAAAPTEVK
jgi:hypothetical protein